VAAWAAIRSSNRDSVLSRATDNGTSGERVGTHSLLAKDDQQSGPFADQALRLAGHVSTAVASRVPRGNRSMLGC
jgi:hypothetical protein